VANYRSITTAYKIDLKNVTVLVGKNNEGKSNLIKALDLAMEILHYVSVTKRRMVPNRSYSWTEDFPISLQNSKKLKNKHTEFRLDFLLNDTEVAAFYNVVGSMINGELSIYIVIKQDNTVSITVPKKGKNAKALSNKLAEIAEFIYQHIKVQYIPAVRSEADAYDVISEIIENEFATTDDEEYKKAEKYIADYQAAKLKTLASQIKVPLSKFMPKIKGVDIGIEDRFSRRRPFLYGKNIAVSIDDGVKTSLSKKGDGVKSLTTMAILSQTSASNRIIIVDEPENHLHPEAIHYLRKTLYGLSETNQVVISTHNPIFVNRNNTSSNIIVDRNEAKPANRIDEVRKMLGVMMSDNLVYSDYVVVVEGLTDKNVLTKVMADDPILGPMLKSNQITIRAIAGVHNLKPELYNLDRYMCRYMVILDNDEAGKKAAKEAKDQLGISNHHFRYFLVEKMKESELEDTIDVDSYSNVFLDEFGIDVTKNPFKNKSRKWSTRIEDVAALSGRILDGKDIDNMKTRLSGLVSEGKVSFSKTGLELIENIITAIRNDLNQK
jgi:predicted ATP-dependent endonuclease of OLD family